MQDTVLQKYARLLVKYCVDLQPGQRLYLDTTTLAEPLVREIYREVLRAGGHMDFELRFREQHRIMLKEGNDEQLEYVSPLFSKAIEDFDAYLRVRAPYNLMTGSDIDPDRRKIAKDAREPIYQVYSERTAVRSLKRNLCQYPTTAAAQMAGMSLEEYEDFVFTACFLHKEDPIAEWLNVRKKQQHIVDYLNQSNEIRYLGEDIDITFSCDGRTWINSDGQTNMPSGEVYTSPVENKVNGKVRFTFPAIFMGTEVEDVTLWVKDGEVYKWEAKRGKELLDSIMKMKGGRIFGEAAIGTNYNIKRFTKNILFDEKIGGTIHMALGQAYLQTGGKNKSPIHWDMIADMRQGGEIHADGEVIYKNGHFLELESHKPPLQHS